MVPVVGTYDLMITRKLLLRVGLDVVTAADGREAVELYRQERERIDLVLLDFTMPHMAGDEAFEELKKIDPDVRVVLASGYAEVDLAKRFAGEGLAGCLQKPYSLAKLRDLLAGLLPAADSSRE